MTDIPRIGETAPDFSAPDQNGNVISLKDKSDRWLVLYFYPKDNTPGCTTQAKDFTEYAAHQKELGANIIGVRRNLTVSLLLNTIYRFSY